LLFHLIHLFVQPLNLLHIAFYVLEKLIFLFFLLLDVDFHFLICLPRFAKFAHEARKFPAAFLGNVDLLNPNATTPGSNPLESILYAIPEACNVACTARSLTSPLPKQ